jgi:hypothetical protein
MAPKKQKVAAAAGEPTPESPPMKEESKANQLYKRCVAEDPECTKVWRSAELMALGITDSDQELLGIAQVLFDLQRFCLMKIGSSFMYRVRPLARANK